MTLNPMMDSPEKFTEALDEFGAKLGDVVCQAEDGLEFMSFAYANKIFPAKIQIAAVQSTLLNNLKIDEGVTYLVVFHCFNQLQEIESQGLMKSIFNKSQNASQIQKINQLWNVVSSTWGLLEGTGRYKKFSEDMLRFLNK